MFLGIFPCPFIMDMKIFFFIENTDICPMPDVSLCCILPFGKENMFWLIFFCRHQHENGNGPNVLSKIFNVIAANTAGSHRDR